jgi:hypothetical protein
LPARIEKAALVVSSESEDRSAAVRLRNADGVSAREVIPGREDGWRCGAATSGGVAAHRTYEPAEAPRLRSSRFSNPVSPTGEIGW